MNNNISIFKLNTYKTKLVELFKFVIHPTIEERYTLNRIEKLKHLFVLFVLGLALATISALTIQLIFGDTKVVALEKMRDNLSPAIFLLIGVLIAPFLEEIIFRLSLKFKPIYLSASLVVFSYYQISDFLDFPKFSFENNFFIRVIGSITFGLIGYLIFTKFSGFLENVWKSKFKWIYYISIFSFAWVHISNFQLDTTESILIGPLLTFPQMIGGIFKGFIRIKYGFLFNLLYHCSNNFIVLSLGLIL